MVRHRNFPTNVSNGCLQLVLLSKLVTLNLCPSTVTFVLYTNSWKTNNKKKQVIVRTRTSSKYIEELIKETRVLNGEKLSIKIRNELRSRRFWVFLHFTTIMMVQNIRTRQSELKFRKHD